MEMTQLTSFFGWCTVINFAFIRLATLAMTAFRGLVLPLQSRMFQVSESEMGSLYLRFVAYFKIATVVLAFTPWMALKLMA